tara:strand:+ start:359 stop:793 length:435 start_codon:yes stop_codon:yes gene_type:complete
LYQALALPKYKSPLDETARAPLITVPNDVCVSNVNVDETNDEVTDFVAKDALVELLTVPSTPAAAIYEADVAKPVNEPVIPDSTFKEPLTLNDPEKTAVSGVVPINISYTSEIKLADINPPDVICARFVDNTPIIIPFFYKYIS